MNTTVGVIGGGQLARMMIPAAVNLGIRIRVLAENEGMSADLAAVQVGDYRDRDVVLAFADTVDVVTFDHEHVPQGILRELVARGVAVHPGPDALLFAQDKLLMRQRLSELGLPVPDWARIENAAELGVFLAAHNGRAVVKTARGGYDGKGVRLVTHEHEADDWFAALAEDGNDGALLVEELVEFRRELAQLVARRPSGQIALWPVVETVQQGGVCAEVIAPAPQSEGRLARAAADIAVRIAEGIGATGMLAVELFETTDERILVNELAMRPHNSGHWSIEGSTTSQFEQHLRAVLDLPLGATDVRDPWTVMVNILGGPASGTLSARFPAVFEAHPAAKVHIYGKDPRPGRKVGHVTVGGDDLDLVAYQARAAAAVFQD
ncbi:5-(carboxyamino)imidazole ribonucleotide synthase [Cryobacterium sp. TMT2-18-3]|uniref:5-(carboxyamino)imidazole ribonucleotide synthase n=1 Tax=unclassified Cryobacterium TaxID=2649013 RepID=UPI00106A8205|nr:MULTISPECIES: 5-(carboxyamino)imidazole ribonucleotide synthase [unclassified Cryobacterium]TFC28644.1 5-(carboxyamino)imidazole ribonucleotide synthase [Cryobacterium sp. TMT2-18-2]TFC33340.1 5-(carboxyamino)imidazole ribonucleotide synthase [Cryobacterium sp. TMT2-42-4]TFC63872.1 5-(carboxyamino)imidazole ribonucleotide synthase [Cryobacterium sp. TMT2-18-3]